MGVIVDGGGTAAGYVGTEVLQDSVAVDPGAGGGTLSSETGVGLQAGGMDGKVERWK